MIVDTGSMDSIVAFIIAIISVVAAYWQNRQKVEVIAAMNPAAPESSSPAVIAKMPAVIWKMSEATKHWLIFECPVAVQESVSRQITDNEAANNAKYVITYPGGHYGIEYGALVHDEGNCVK